MPSASAATVSALTRTTNREGAIRATLRTTLADLTARFGSDPTGWTWGRLHTLTQKHVLSGCGDLGTLLDLSGPHLYPRHSIASAIVYQANGSEVDTVIADGAVLVRGRQLAGTDHL